jgi:hypothetical protein
MPVEIANSTVSNTDFDAGRTALTITGFDNGSVRDGPILADGRNWTVRARVFVSCGFAVSNNFGVGPTTFVCENANDGQKDCEVEAVGVFEPVGLGDWDRVGVGE